uniref:Uncharacterized protein n=1 Tax=Arundo donax TaxID=35708 RepID=A0A0A8Y061_ARUDO
MDRDGKGSLFERKDEHREYLRRKNILLALEVAEKITAKKCAQIFLRLVYHNTVDLGISIIYFGDLILLVPSN